MRLICIRHGQTTGDVEDRYGGSYDDALSPEGESQVRAMVEELADGGIEQIFSSPLKRALQTAESLGARLGCAITRHDALRERDRYGALSGMTKAEAAAAYPDWVDRLADRFQSIPGSETYEAASQRIRAACDHVLKQTRTCSAIVWHGGGMGILFHDLLKKEGIGTIGDCGWVELETTGALDTLSIRRMKRIEGA